MLEPQLPHNLERYRTLGRLQVIVLVATPIVGTLVTVAAAALSAPAWTEWLAFPIVIGALAWMGVLAVQKVLVFRRDLKERRAVVGSR